WTGSLPSRARPTICCAYETWRPFQRCRSGPKCARRRLELDLGTRKTPEIKQSDIINDNNHKEESSTNQFFSSLLGNGVHCDYPLTIRRLRGRRDPYLTCCVILGNTGF